MEHFIPLGAPVPTRNAASAVVMWKLKAGGWHDRHEALVVVVADVSADGPPVVLVELRHEGPTEMPLLLTQSLDGPLPGLLQVFLLTSDPKQRADIEMSVDVVMRAA